MIRRGGLAILFLFCLSVLPADQPDYPTLKMEAERLYAEGSFDLAHQSYQKAQSMKLSPEDAHWTAFRLADTLWRSKAATNQTDPTVFDEARMKLEKLLGDEAEEEEGAEHDRVWAEVQESLGDFWWTRLGSPAWGQAWDHYEPALDWWGGCDEIEPARERYIRIVWKIAGKEQRDDPYRRNQYGWFPTDILENALNISQNVNDKARAHFLLAETLRDEKYVRQEYEAVLQLGKSTEWYDDALFRYAEWLLGERSEYYWRAGQQCKDCDSPKALELYRRLVEEFRRGETRYMVKQKAGFEPSPNRYWESRLWTFFFPARESCSIWIGET